MGLFGKKKESVPEKNPAIAKSPGSNIQNDITYFGKNLKIKGNVTGNGNMIIMGEFDGEFDLKGEITISEPARVKGTVKAGILSVKGSVDGSLTATTRMNIEKTANIKGRIITPIIAVVEGAQFNGEIEMTGSN